MNILKFKKGIFSLNQNKMNESLSKEMSCLPFSIVLDNIRDPGYILFSLAYFFFLMNKEFFVT